MFSDKILSLNFGQFFIPPKQHVPDHFVTKNLTFMALGK
jgi:hypothetical protein